MVNVRLHVLKDITVTEGYVSDATSAARHAAVQAMTSAWHVRQDGNWLLASVDPIVLMVSTKLTTGAKSVITHVGIVQVK